MKYILDTDILSLLRKSRVDRNLLAWLAPIPEADLNISATTIAEIYYGLHHARRIGASSLVELEEWVLKIPLAHALTLDGPAARILGAMHAEPGLRDFLVTQPAARHVRFGADLQIAAIALRHEATVVTGNFEDFARIATYFPTLRIIDPIARHSLPADDT